MNGWDRYGAFYERRAREQERQVRARPRWKKAAGWLLGAAAAAGFWFLFFYLGMRLWKP